MIDNITRRDSGMAYFADESVTAQQLVAKKCIRKYNQMMPFDLEGLKCLDEAGIKHSGSLYLEPPFHCEYGTHIQVDDNFYANAFCVMLDVGKITIGDNVFFGPSVSVYTAGHPIHPVSRRSMYEYGIPVEIGNDVWVGGNSVILPGVKIGNNVVIGAGSVVTKNIPDNVIAAGNPCKVIRKITEEDRKFYFKDKVFDDEIWDKVKNTK